MHFSLHFPRYQQHNWTAAYLNTFNFQNALYQRRRCSAVRILLQSKECAFIFFRGPRSFYLNLWWKSIFTSINFSPRVVPVAFLFHPVYVLASSSQTAGMKWRVAFRSRSTALSLKLLSTRDKCDEQRGREASRPVIDTGATSRGQSHASKKRGHRFYCPLNKQRDISPLSLLSLTAACPFKTTYTVQCSAAITST